jgi:hypothetical protein
MNWLRKLDRLALNFLKLMIALRVAGRIRGNKQEVNQNPYDLAWALNTLHRSQSARRSVMV